MSEYKIYRYRWVILIIYMFVAALTQLYWLNVAAIETFTANKTKTWQWHINGKKVEKPFYEIIVRPNDEILIKYAQ